MPAFFLRSKANELEEMRGFHYFPLWIPLGHVKVYVWRVFLTWHRKFGI